MALYKTNIGKVDRRQAAADSVRRRVRL